MDKKREEKQIYALPVVVDKNHLITIGEQLYSESIELIRELVNNAYDVGLEMMLKNMQRIFTFNIKIQTCKAGFHIFYQK